MTFSVVPFALQNGSHSADVFRQAVASLLPSGGGIIQTGDFAVTQTGTPSMNVSIGVGRIWIPGTNVGNVAGGNFSSQAMYYGQNDSAYTASVATSDPINPRIDVVYAAVQDSQYSGISNAGVLATVAGVPTSGAAYPANAPALPANAKALAWILVPANASSIVNANITSLARPRIGPATGLVSRVTAPGVAVISTGTKLVTGNISVDTQPRRIYEVSAAWTFGSDTAGTYVQFSLRSGMTGTNAATGTELVDSATTVLYANVGYGQTFRSTSTFDTGAGGPNLIGLCSQIVVNTSATVSGAAGSWHIRVTDIGPA